MTRADPWAALPGIPGQSEVSIQSIQQQIQIADSQVAGTAGINHAKLAAMNYAYGPVSTETNQGITVGTFSKVTNAGATATLTTTGGPVLSMFSARLIAITGPAITGVLSLGFDGTADPAGTDGQVVYSDATNVATEILEATIQLFHIHTGVAPGTHTFEVYARLVSAGGTRYDVKCGNRNRMFAVELR